MVNYIIITGGVISGLGKGITTASIGKILQLHGYKVTAMKIDPYMNFDAWIKDNYYSHYREYTAKEYVQLLTLSGFKEIKFKRTFITI